MTTPENQPDNKGERAADVVMGTWYRKLIPNPRLDVPLYIFAPLTGVIEAVRSLVGDAFKARKDNPHD